MMDTHPAVAARTAAAARAHEDPPRPPATSLDSALRAELESLDSLGLRRTLREVRRLHGAVVEVDGREMVDFASNDYLGLAADRRLADAARDFLADEGVGAGAARLIAGNHPAHEALERALAALKNTESALLFPTGYMANVGAIAALAGRGDVIYSDALNHASLVDGCRLSRATVRIVPHNDTAALDAMLAAERSRFRRALIVTDSVFSMNGDLAPLPALIDVARRHGAWTYVDDAHATGVLGPNGRGAVEHWQVEGEVDVIMGTLGKALGCAGAFVAGSAALRELLLNTARAFMFTTGSPPAIAAAALAALRVAEEEPWRRTRLAENGERLRRALGEQGVAAAVATGAPAGRVPHIVPIIIGESTNVMRAGGALRDRGFLVGAVRPPTVPAGTARLRITVSAAHEHAQIDALARAIGDACREAGAIAPGDAPRGASPR
ncbi:MAG TPA: 8-amino-7-oxononanoate synthase [Gemmatimonadaceae bacterium]|nr:8-amino-7-oxononanoate synthase [Gemmatimonadaceae bacterium]